MRKQFSKLQDKLTGLLSACHFFPDRFKGIRELVEQYSDDINDEEACDFYDSLDGCINELSEINLDDLLQARLLLKDRVERRVEERTRLVKAHSLAKLEEDVPEEIEMSQYFDAEGQERQLKGRRVRKLSGVNQAPVTEAQRRRNMPRVKKG